MSHCSCVSALSSCGLVRSPWITRTPSGADPVWPRWKIVTSSPRASAASTSAGPTKSVPPRTRTLRGIELRHASRCGLVGSAQEQRRNHAEQRQDRDEREGPIERGAECVRRICLTEFGNHRCDLRGCGGLPAVLDELGVLPLQRPAELGGGQLVT